MRNSVPVEAIKSRQTARNWRSKTHTNRCTIGAATAAFAPLIVMHSAAAQTWVGNGSNMYWDVASNWNTDSVPNSSSNDVTNSTAFTVNYRQNTDTDNSYTSSDGGGFLMSGGILSLINAFITIGAYSQTGGTLTAGSFSTSSTFSMSAGTMNVGSFTQTGSGALTLSGGTLNDTGNLTTSSTVLMSGGTLQNATITNPSLLSFGNNSGNLFDNVTLGGASGLTVNCLGYNQNGLLQIADSFTFASGSTFNLGTTTYNGGGGYLFFDSTSGNLNPTFNNATVNFGSAGGGNIGYGSGFSGTNETLTLGNNLVIQGTGTIGNVGYFGNSGANLVNNGLINANITNDGLNVDSGYSGGYNGTVTNNGTIEATASGASLNMNAGTFVNTGTVQVNSGGTATFGAATSTQTSGTTIDNGTLKITNLNNAASTYNLTGGTMYGSGTITGNINNTGATFSAGTLGATPTTGTLTETGNYTQTTGATFSAALGGSTQGSGYDFFTVSGSVVLGGDLEIDLLNGFMPTAGESFTIISDTGQTGTFSNTPGNTIMDESGRYLFTVFYGANSVILDGQGGMPEPAAGSLLLFAAAPGTGLAIIRRRGKRNCAFN